MTTLAEPLGLPCGLVLPNRILKAATSEGLATAHQLPTRGHASLYTRWAAGGAGLLVTGNVLVDPRHRIARGDAALGSDDAVPAFRAWARAVPEPTCFFLQLNHPGRQSPRFLTREPVAPCAVPMKHASLFARPRALGAREIEALVVRFGEAARRAEAAGFHGVELHAAHGYLAHQFLSARTNQRDDAWGGSPSARRRFVLELVRAVRARVRSGFAVAVKLDAGRADDAQVEERLDTVHALADEGVDLLELSGGTYEHEPALGRAAPTTRPARPAYEAYFAPFAALARARVKIPLAVTGGFRSTLAMEDAVTGGIADVIGLARPLIADPELPRRLLQRDRVRVDVSRLRIGAPFLDAAAELFAAQRAIGTLARAR